MNFTREIAEKLDNLPHGLQAQVLRYIAAPSAPGPVGENGADLRRFSSTLDPVSAQGDDAGDRRGMRAGRSR
jgi:hypothetical protein